MKNPLAEVLLLPSNGARKKLIGCARLMNECTVRKPQEEGMMSTATSFPLVRNQGLIDQQEKRVTSEGVASEAT